MGFFGTLNVLGIRHGIQKALLTGALNLGTHGTYLASRADSGVRKNVTSFNQAAALRPGWGKVEVVKALLTYMFTWES